MNLDWKRWTLLSEASTQITQMIKMRGKEANLKPKAYTFIRIYCTSKRWWLVGAKSLLSTTGMRSKIFLKLQVKSKIKRNIFYEPRQWALKTISSLSTAVIKKMDLSIKQILRIWEMGPFRRRMNKIK